MSKSMLVMTILGPVLGGVIGFYLGWRWIFWFLTILSGSSLTAVLFTLPETARNLVKDGRVKPPRASMLPFPQLFPLLWTSDSAPHRRLHIPNPLKSLVLMKRKDRALLITTAGMIYVAEQAPTITWSSIFVRKYGINDLDAGLIYLSPGIGFALGGVIASWMMDRDYRIVARKYGIKVDRSRSDNLEDFTIEEARLRNVIWPLLLLAACFVGTGWAIDKHVVSLLAIESDFIMVGGY